jgi:YggT family protein
VWRVGYPDHIPDKTEPVMHDFFILLIQLLQLFTNVLITVIIVQFILGLLIMFNVVSMSNQYVGAVYQALNSILDPILRPVRKLMPDTGMIDLSPIVVIFAINALMLILKHAANQV